ncbi:hypothetical protein H4R21_002894, partial [Coemansia helicoidea]
MAKPDQVVCAKGPLAAVWRGTSEQLLHLEWLVVTTNVVTLHAFSLACLIFTTELWRNVAFDPGIWINQTFFYEVWTALTDMKKRKVKKGREARELVSQHIKPYMEANLLEERIEFKCAAAVGAYEAEKMQAAFVTNIKLRFGNMLRCAVNLLLGVKVGVAALKAQMEERGATDDEIKAACKERFWDPARQAKVALAARKPDLSDIPLQS